MTAHKSRSSEFVHTALLLPTTINPILTRERVYTGITRARPWLTLVEAKRGVLNEAVVREVTEQWNWEVDQPLGIVSGRIYGNICAT